MFSAKNILPAIALFIGISANMQFGCSKQTMKRIFLLLLIPLLMLKTASAQDIKKLSVIKKHLYINHNSVPFDSVLILDNKINTPIVSYTTLTMRRIQPMHIACPLIQNYPRKLMRKMKKGNAEILINIKQLRMPNNPSMKTNMIMLSADVYYKNENGKYRKLISIENKHTYMVHKLYGFTANVADAISMILNEWLSISAYVYEKDVLNASVSNRKYEKKIINLITTLGGIADCSKDTAEYTMQQINVNVKTLWENYSIANKEHFAAGVYETFDDFKNDKLLTSSIPQLKLSPVDSTYYLLTAVSTSSPYAVSDGENLYINIGDYAYLPLKQEGNTFYFRVPNPLPNMYALFAIGANTGAYTTVSNNIDVSSISAPTTGNAVADLAGYGAAVVFGVGMNALINSVEKHKIRKLTKQGLNNDNYRECYIDMDSGDFIY